MKDKLYLKWHFKSVFDLDERSKRNLKNKILN